MHYITGINDGVRRQVKPRSTDLHILDPNTGDNIDTQSHMVADLELAPGQWVVQVVAKSRIRTQAELAPRKVEELQR